MEKKTDWIKTIFIGLVIFLAYKYGEYSKEYAVNREAYEQALYLTNNELEEVEERIQSRDSLIQQLNQLIYRLEK